MTVLRVIAMLVALGGVLDPAVSLSRTVSTPVRLHVDPSDPDAADVQARLRAATKDRLEFVGHGDAAAHVVVGGVRPDPQVFSKPVSLVTLRDSTGTEIVSVPSVVQLPVNSSASIAVTIRARGLAGQSSVVMLEEGEIELTRAEHRWTGDETATIQLPYLALRTGSRRLSVRIEPAKGERRLFDNRVDLLAMAEPRAGRIAVIEPRPSWPAGFVRRELENDPAFRVASIIRASIDVATRAGESPRAITFDQLLPFEVVIAGAPEELRAGEVDALRRFAELRGGTVVLLPDRRPSGAYLELLPGTATEQLLTEPRVLEPAGIPASEILSIPLSAGVRSLASLNGAPVIFSWPLGAGRLLFSGALDAWRYRADPRSRARAFWRDAIMTSALAAPAPVRVEIQPSVVRSGRTTRVIASVRPTELAAPAAAGGEGGSFAIEARVTDPRGRDDIVRLHPTMNSGVLEGLIATSLPGVYAVTVTLANGARTQSTFVAHDDGLALSGSGEALERVPELTAGVTVASSDLSPLVRHLSDIPQPSRRLAAHPMRSVWWMVVFAAALCAEWTLRRRSGLR
jgi:hypothetical protein